MGFKKLHYARSCCYYNGCVVLQNQDGVLSKDEFVEGSKCDPWVVQSLNMSLTEARPTLGSAPPLVTLHG